MKIEREFKVKNVFKIHKMLKALPKDKNKYPSLPKMFKTTKKKLDINENSGHFISVTRGYFKRTENFLKNY
jgi:hypothetical protein